MIAMEDMSDNDNKTDEGASEKTTLRFPREVLTRLRQTVLHAQRSDPAVTMTSVVVRGAELVIHELDKKHGKAPKAKDVKLRAGRRLSA